VLFAIPVEFPVPPAQYQLEDSDERGAPTAAKVGAGTGVLLTPAMRSASPAPISTTMTRNRIGNLFTVGLWEGGLLEVEPD
jgi:hypothetical protein